MFFKKCEKHWSYLHRLIMTRKESDLNFCRISIECYRLQVSSEKFKGYLVFISLSAKWFWRVQNFGIFIVFAIIYLINHSKTGKQMVGILSCMLQPPSPNLANYLIHLFKASALVMIQRVVYLILQEKPLSSNYKQISLLETNLENLSVPFSTSCMRK